MPLNQPWVMAVQSDAASAHERAWIAHALEFQISGQREWMLLSTCHRVELYGFGAMPDLDARLQITVGEEAVMHLLRVATGLESTIIGEDEVLHQVRDALRQARESRELDRRLQRLFEQPSPQAVEPGPGAPPPAATLRRERWPGWSRDRHSRARLSLSWEPAGWAPASLTLPGTPAPS